MSGWDPYVEKNIKGNQDVPNVGSNPTYFSGEDDGHQVKKGWVYTVPAQAIDAKAYDDDEEKYMYFNNSGVIVADQFKKINGKYYVFNRTGVMKTGLVIWCGNGTSDDPELKGSFKYVDKIDLDWATGEEITKKGIYRTGQNETIQVNSDGIVQGTDTNNEYIHDGASIKLHLFGEDGARKTGMNTVEFSDETYTINTVGGSGDKGSGVFAKKYYSLGFLLKASPDIRYGIYQIATESRLKPQHNGTNWLGNEIEYENELEKRNYIVLTTSGSMQKGNNNAKKDADGNYWMISSDDNALRGIFTVGVKEYGDIKGFKTKTIERLNWSTDTEYSTTYLLNHDETEGLFSSDIRDGHLKEEISDITKWTLHTTDTNSYFTCDYKGPVFQSDYGEGSNKWIPFGMLDNSLKTVTFKYTSAQYQDSKDYSVNPTNDHFLNCYWN